MLLKFCLAGLATVFALSSALAAAEECPAKSNQMDDIIAVLNKAPNCDSAMKIFEACEFGTSADIHFGAVIEKTCETDFLSGLRAPQKKAYVSQLSHCDAKYRNEDGTMYRSFTAFCRAEVSQRYARQALKEAGPKAH